GRLLTETSPMGFTTSYSYNGFGNLLSETDANGNTTYHIYNAVNNFIRDSLPDGSLINYSYDLAGNITQISATGGAGETTTNTYDLLNRLTSVTVDYNGLFSKTIFYTYDAAGNRISMTDPQGGITTYSWDNAYRLVSMTDPDADITTYQYDDISRMTQLNHPNGTHQQYSYDGADRLTNLQILDNSMALMLGNSFTYDAVGNKLSRNETTPPKGAIAGKSVSTTLYHYDPVYRLTKVDYPGGDTVQYQYDPVGNRTQEITNGISGFYSYDADNRLVFASENNTNHQYDPNGNLINKFSMAGNDHYDYDYKNRLTGVLHNGTPVASYGYSAAGERLYKSDGGANTIYYLYDYDDWWADYSHPEIYNPIAEYNASGAIEASYNPGPGIDQIQSITRGGQKYFFHEDDLGSPVKITNAIGNVANEYEYDAFGEILQENETVSQPFRFTGREYDSESDLYYYRARYYNQESGRYLSKDPWGMVNGPNTYLYTLSNPVNMVDPSGLRFQLRTGSRNKPLLKPELLSDVLHWPDFEFEFSLTLESTTQSYPSVQLGPIYMDQKAKKCWQSSTTRINEWKFKDNFWFYLALWFQVHIDRDLIDKAAKDAEKASDMATTGDLVGAINQGIGYIPVVGDVLSVAIDIASSGLDAGGAYESAIEKLNNAIQGAHADLADYYFAHDHWQSDFEDVGYIIEGSPKEVCC
ncbi:MAG: RHS repeat-associated core domain-containing protein, partial [Bacteroidetes bacterium]|nr:RHS repeat-associated core domain-containing protein [Bacteroidota bacterium]